MQSELKTNLLALSIDNHRNYFNLMSKIDFVPFWIKAHDFEALALIQIIYLLLQAKKLYEININMSR
jgi:hypothetical protein